MAEPIVQDIDAIRTRLAEIKREEGECARAQSGEIRLCWCSAGDGPCLPCPPAWDAVWQRKLSAPASAPFDPFHFPPLSPVPWFPPRNAPKIPP